MPGTDMPVWCYQRDVGRGAGCNVAPPVVVRCRYKMPGADLRYSGTRWTLMAFGAAAALLTTYEAIIQ
eukprot:2575536-Rhodomonas_salina.1